MNAPAIREMQLEKDKSDVLSTGMFGDTQNFSTETAAQVREAVSICPIRGLVNDNDEVCKVCADPFFQCTHAPSCHISC